MFFNLVAVQNDLLVLVPDKQVKKNGFLHQSSDLSINRH